jgi:hypothetical protein
MEPQLQDILKLVFKFALEVFILLKSDWGVSYDGRRADNNLPVKFPFTISSRSRGNRGWTLTKVLPHNFNELLMLP